MDFALRLLTLNCWGIPQPYPIGSKDRVKRIKAIADELATGKYDIVALEEIWSEDDFNFIRKLAKSVLPYSFYFHSGYLGSGVCVFSKSPIIDTLMHRYSLNGYAHHVHRGDWFGGKVVGMAKVLHRNTVINVYTTHVHAEYDKQQDLYLPHRVVQAYELSQFIKYTSAGSDLFVVMGDLNLEPMDLGYRLILANGELKDAWEERIDKYVPEGSCSDGNTCERPSNIYSSVHSLKLWPQGKRIDYILYHYNRGVNVKVNRCYPALTLIPDTKMPYSDHEAVVAEFSVQKLDATTISSGVSFARSSTEEKTALLRQAMSVIETGLGSVVFNRRFFMAAIAVLVLLFFYTIDIELSYSQFAIMVIASRFLVTLLIGFCFWYGFVMLTMEEKALKAAKYGMEVLLRTDNHTNGSTE